MTDIEVTIGWTRRFTEGYTPGAEQHTETIPLRFAGPDGILDLDGLESIVQGIAEAAYMATNHPAPETFDRSTVAGQIFEALDARGFDGSQSGHYSLSVGDTVTVGEVMLVCAACGWDRVVGAVS